MLRGLIRKLTRKVYSDEMEALRSKYETLSRTHQELVHLQKYSADDDIDQIVSEMHSEPSDPISRRILNNLLLVIKNKLPYTPSNIFRGVEYIEKPIVKKRGRPLGTKNTPKKRGPGRPRKQASK